MASLETSKLVRNERAKLLATYFNSIATAVMAAGVIAPLIGAFTSASAAPGWQLVLIFLCCIPISAGLHYGARRILGGLIE
jgi:hypothetical protein